jgi:surfeit locus 1 family protein
MTSELRPAPARGFPWGLTIAAFCVFVILCGLGTWQLQRMAWKRDLIARVDALQHAPARPLDAVLAEAKAGRDVAFTRVEAVCPGLGHAPFERLYSLKDGQAGERLISACRLPDGGAVLVDRGFLPLGAQPPAVDPADRRPAAIVGVLRKPDPGTLFTPAHRPGGRWFVRDLPAMARALSVPPPAPYFLAVETQLNPETAALQPAPVPTNISNRHLGYVITWFGMAAALAAVYAGLLRQRLKAA